MTTTRVPIPADICSPFIEASEPIRVPDAAVRLELETAVQQRSWLKNRGLDTELLTVFSLSPHAPFSARLIHIQKRGGAVITDVCTSVPEVHAALCRAVMDQRVSPYFFWLDMHGVPDTTLGAVWASLGLDQDLQLRGTEKRARDVEMVSCVPPEVYVESADGPDACRVLPQSRTAGEYYVSMELCTLLAFRGVPQSTTCTCVEEEESLLSADILRKEEAPIQSVITEIRNSEDAQEIAVYGTPDVDDMPVVVTTQLRCFHNGCVTWCPRSTYGVLNRTQDTCTRVKDWHRLQDAVDASMREETITTARFVSLLLSTVCYAYLPDTTALLNEVEAIDAMLPLIVPERESDQADALRRVLLLRRRLAVHRRLLFQKVRLLEELQRPVMRTVASFMYDKRASSLEPTHEEVIRVLAKLDAARVVLGNTTLIYTSCVTLRNFKSSTDTDLYMLILQYMMSVVLPLTVLTALWGMNCYLPWRDTGSLTPFWGLIGVMGLIFVVGVLGPMWAYRTGLLNWMR